MSKGEGRSRTKCLAYVAIFLVFQIAVITVFALTVMKVKSPKVRFNAMVVESFSSTGGNNSTAINMRLLAQFTIKNTNFGHFKYDNSTLVVLYNGVPLGEAAIPKGRTKARKTQRFNVGVDLTTARLSSPGDGNLGNDINSGVLRLSSQAKLSGKVHLMKVMKKKKSGQMNCDWEVNLSTRQIQNLRCN